MSERETGARHVLPVNEGEAREAFFEDRESHELRLTTAWIAWMRMQEIKKNRDDEMQEQELRLRGGNPIPSFR